MPSIKKIPSNFNHYLLNGLNTDLHLDIGNGVSLEKVDKFCYLGDMLDADRGCDSAATELDLLGKVL